MFLFEHKKRVAGKSGEIIDLVNLSCAVSIC